jgi:hypothetical protein
MRNRNPVRKHFATLVSFVAVALMGLLAVPAIAALQPVEQILRVAKVGHPSAGLGIVESRLIFPPGARWEIDPEAGPVTMTVETGKIGVVLGGGQARVVRHVNPLQERRIHPLQPEQMTFLWPGDQLVVVRGYGLRVDNDDDAPAMAHVSRVVREPLPVLSMNR